MCVDPKKTLAKAAFILHAYNARNMLFESTQMQLANALQAHCPGVCNKNMSSYVS